MENDRRFDRALHHSYETLPHKPRWLALSTVTGEHLGHYFQPAVQVEIDRITALAAAAAGHHERRSMEHALGAARWGITLAERGFVVTAFVTSEWILSLMFAETDLAALMDTLQALPEVAERLAAL